MQKYKTPKTKTHNIAFGRVLLNLRANKMWSQEHLGFEAGLTRTTISLLERGLRSPTLDTIMMICEALDITVHDFTSLLAAEIPEINGRK